MPKHDAWKKLKQPRSSSLSTKDDKAPVGDTSISSNLYQFFKNTLVTPLCFGADNIPASSLAGLEVGFSGQYGTKYRNMAHLIKEMSPHISSDETSLLGTLSDREGYVFVESKATQKYAKVFFDIFYDVEDFSVVSQFFNGKPTKHGRLSPNCLLFCAAYTARGPRCYITLSGHSPSTRIVKKLYEVTSKLSHKFILPF